MIRPDTMLCRPCGWIGCIRGIAKCPECYSRDLISVTHTDVAEVLRLIIDTVHSETVHSETRESA